MKKIVFLMADAWACGLYRCYMPALWMNKLGLAEAYCSFHGAVKGSRPLDYQLLYGQGLVNQAGLIGNKNFVSEEGLFAEYAGVDAVVYQRQEREIALSHLRFMKAHGKRVYCEFDDSLTGHPIKATAKHWQSPEKVKLYTQMCEEATGVIVTNEVLGNEFRRLNSNILVLPNSIDCTQYRDGRADLSIGYAGSPGHKRDFKYISYTLTKLARKYAVKFMGYKPDDIKAEYMGSTKIGDYPDKLSGAFSVGVAPLIRDDFSDKKCLVGDTLVVSVNGIKKINSLKIGDLVIQSDKSVNKIIGVTKYNNQDTIKITTSNGYTVEGTPNHKILDSCGNWVMLSDLLIGSCVAITKFGIKQIKYQSMKFPLLLTKGLGSDIFNEADDDMLPQIIINEKWGLLLGFLFGDGHMHGFNRVAISCSTDYPDIIELVEKLFKGCGMRVNSAKRYDKRLKDGTNRLAKGVDVIANSRILRLLFESMGFVGRNGKVFRVPQIIFNSPKSVIREFLKGLFESDGCIADATKGHVRLTFCTKNKRFAEDIAILLLGFGIKSKSGSMHNKIYNRDYYIISLGREGIDLFATDIGFVSDKKKKRLMNAVDKKRGNIKKWEWNDNIVSICFSRNDVYDIEVENKHSYIANGFISHNSNIKWLEYSLSGIATIAEDFGPYQCIRNGEDGYLANRNWDELIEHLMNDESERERIVRNAQERIRKEYSIENTVHNWANLL